MTDIVITGSAARVGGMVRQVGTRVSVPEHTAIAFVRAGRARLAEEPSAAPPAREPVIANPHHLGKKRK